MDTKQLPDKAMLTAADVAKAAGVSVVWVRRLLTANRELRGEKVGRDWVISRREAQRWLSERGQ